MKPINKEISKGIGEEATQDKAVIRDLKLGLDVHYRQVTVAMQEDGGRIKAAGKMSHGAFLEWIRTKLEKGWQLYSCYEAGASGYWLLSSPTSTALRAGSSHRNWFKVAAGINGILPASGPLPFIPLLA